MKKMLIVQLPVSKPFKQSESRWATFGIGSSSRTNSSQDSKIALEENFTLIEKPVFNQSLGVSSKLIEEPEKANEFDVIVFQFDSTNQAQISQVFSQIELLKTKLGNDAPHIVLHDPNVKEPKFGKSVNGVEPQIISANSDAAFYNELNKIPSDIKERKQLLFPDAQQKLLADLRGVLRKADPRCLSTATKNDKRNGSGDVSNRELACVRSIEKTIRALEKGEPVEKTVIDAMIITIDKNLKDFAEEKNSLNKEQTELSRQNTHNTAGYSGEQASLASTGLSTRIYHTQGKIDRLTQMKKGLEEAINPDQNLKASFKK